MHPRESFFHRNLNRAHQFGMKSAIRLLLAVVVLAPMSVFACSARNHSNDAPPSIAHQQELANLPPAFKATLPRLPEKDQQAFLNSPADERAAIATEWQRREKMLASFTPAERTIISTLSQDDSAEFFKIPGDQRAQQEKFLTDAVNVFLSSLDQCLANTHRRFGPAVEPKLSPRSLATFTPPEQAVIMRFTPVESQQFFALSKTQQEDFLSATVNRRIDQLLSCATRTNRRLGEPS